MRNKIILGGTGVLALAWIADHLNVDRNDPVFWYVFVPLTIALGLFIQHQQRNQS